MGKESLIDKSIDKLFSLKKETFFIILIFIIGFFIRILTAFGKKFSGDEMVHGTHLIGFINSGKLQIMDQSAIWFWLGDLFLKIFGVNMFGIRFTSILFGSLSLILIYLIGKSIFNKKVGLIASILAAISSYGTSFMEANMDTTMTFFAIFSIYLFILFINEEETKFFYLSWISMGIAVMAKPIALLLLVGLGLSSLYYEFKKYKKINFKRYIILIILLLIIFTPVLTFNYLLFKDKGMVDLQFSRFTRISFETYESIAPTIESFSFHTLFVDYGANNPGIFEAFSYLSRYETFLVLLFAVIGLFYLFKTKNKFIFLLIATFIIPFLFLAGTSLLPNHFIFTSYYVTLLSAFGIFKASNLLLKNEKHRKILISLIILIILIMTYAKMIDLHSGNIYNRKNELGKLINFKEDNIEDNSLVVLDGRIYRGRTVFMFWDKNYIEGSIFLDILSNQNNMPGNTQEFVTYYVECIPDDCGWGTIDEQPEFNETMESLTQEFKKQSEIVKTIKDGNENSIFNVYKTTILLKSETLPIVRSTHQWFYYPINYKPQSKIFDNYQTDSFFDKLLDLIAHLILYIEIAITFLICLSLFYFLERKQ